MAHTLSYSALIESNSQQKIVEVIKGVKYVFLAKNKRNTYEIITFYFENNFGGT